MSNKKQTRKEFRKEIKQPDEFVTQSNRAIRWASENPSQVKLGIAAFVALLVVVAGIGIWNDSRHKQSLSDFYAANELYKRAQWEPAYEGFVELADNLSSTPYGQLANLYAGRAAQELGRDTEAVKSFRAYLANELESKPIEQLARLNLARALAAAGNPEAARKEFEAAATIQGPAGPEIQLALARHHESTGNPDQALDAYLKYATETPRSAATNQVNARIQALGGTVPAPAPPSFPGNIQVSQN
ncbi:MAG: tetratricopeptide repeat protein [Deltaproteobacteria bacterium]